jgi:hypothetical protein
LASRQPGGIAPELQGSGSSFTEIASRSAGETRGCVTGAAEPLPPRHADAPMVTTSRTGTRSLMQYQTPATTRKF